ncbi:MAG: hypothetical protein FD153_1436 [Rhodospirillaceae bacterium]|nr:MAG: hypothetical protein FD153_1436 [Rhodospirillaceae bacterium]
MVESVERLLETPAPVPTRYGEAMVVAVTGLSVSVASLFLLGEAGYAHGNGGARSRDHEDLPMPCYEGDNGSCAHADESQPRSQHPLCLFARHVRCRDIRRSDLALAGGWLFD